MKTRIKRRGKIIFLLFFCLFLGVIIKERFFFNTTPHFIHSQSSYQSKSVYVYNLTDNKEERSYKAEEKQAPASLVKIMTTYLALEKTPDLSASVNIDKNTYQTLVAENSSMAGFIGNEKVTYRDLLYGTMLPSGGECANTLAIRLSGSQENFIQEMNQKAKELHLSSTCYTTCEGLDSKGQYTTAKDVCTLLRHALQNNHFRTIFTTHSYVSSQTLDHPEGVYMQSTVFKKLKGQPMDHFQILGGKSGTTDEAGLCWATYASKGGKEYIIVVMGAPYYPHHPEKQGQMTDTLAILNDL